MRRAASEEARRWLTQAQDEFKDADELRRRGRFYLALFHFQQAAEKALKAFLYQVAASEEVFFTHSIYELVQLAVKADPEMESLSKAARLDQYYIPTRYPNGLPGGIPSRFYNDPDEAREASELAQMVLERVERKIGGLTPG
jgi:HEPN domain-containing protein